MDKDLLQLIRDVAEVPTSDETPGVAADCELDDLVALARSIVRREEQKTRPRLNPFADAVKGKSLFEMRPEDWFE